MDNKVYGKINEICLRSRRGRTIHRLLGVVRFSPVFAPKQCVSKMQLIALFELIRTVSVDKFTIYVRTKAE
jgi:hypothetical protein